MTLRKIAKESTAIDIDWMNILDSQIFTLTLNGSIIIFPIQAEIVEPFAVLSTDRCM